MKDNQIPQKKPILIYNIFPRLAGKFDDWKEHIDRAKNLKFTHIYVNPFVYPGFSGSLYSIKDNEKINPDFLNKDSKYSEWDQVKVIIAYCHSKGLKFIFDLVINHTAIDSPWTEDHPEWYLKDDEGKILKPFCMDNGKKIIWGDLAELDLEEKKETESLHEYWKNYVINLIDYGIDGFRCDAAYQVPVNFWKKLIDASRTKKKDVDFFAETLGCDYKDVIKLSNAGFDFSFNSSKYWDFNEPWALNQNALNVGVSESISFAESHDTERLANEVDGNIEGIKLRYLFSVIFSTGMMMPLGLEFAFRKRVDVTKTSPDDWEETGIDLSDFIAKANSLKYDYRVFSQDSPIERIPYSGNIIALMKTSHFGIQKALIIINRDLEQHQDFFTPDLFRLFGDNAHIEDVSIEHPMERVDQEFHYSLRPGQVILLVQNI